MGSLIRRHNGYYYGVFSQRGKRVWRSLNTQSLDEAQAAYAQTSTEFISYKRITISEFRSHLRAILEGTLAPGTVEIYDRALSSLESTIGNRPLKSINPFQVDTFKAKRSKEVSLTTVHIEFRTLKAAFSRAVAYGFVEQNPFLLTKNISLPQRDPSFITKEDFARLLAVVDCPQMRAIILLAVCTMMRQGELVNLRWSDVNLQSGVIRLPARKTKTPRTVFLNRSALKVLASLPRNSEYVSTGASGKKLCGRSVSRKFKKYARAAGLPESIHYHSLRHTGATWLVQNNVPLPYVKDVMGHANISTTMVYAHTDAVHLKDSVQTFDHYLQAEFR